MAFSISFKKTQNTKTDTIILGIFEQNKLSAAAKAIDHQEKGLIKECLKNHPNFVGKSGQTLSLAIKEKTAGHLILVGLGAQKTLSKLELETVGGKLHTALKSNGSHQVSIYVGGTSDKTSLTEADIATHIALGLKLKSYRFNKYKSKNKKDSQRTIKSITFVTDDAKMATKSFKAYNAISDGVFLARDLVNEPPNTLYPASYAERIKEELKPLGVDVEVLNEKKLTKLGFNALLSVGQGSIRESQVVIMRWNGDKKAKKSASPSLALVGKGVTFDTGGISLKPGAEMDLMKMDMGGSAAVVGAMKAIAGRNAKTNVVGIVGLVENMPSDRAYRPGDVIGSLSGKTIEILNTDAEGRLVLADLLTYVQNKYKPEVIIDLATLTGAIMVALGFEYCGAFTNDDNLWSQINNASTNTGEKFWRMPLDQAYRDEMISEIGDLKNLGSLGRYGGACSAAGFLEHFVEDGTKWAHIDIAGTAWGKVDKPTTPKGGTGFAVRALDDLIKKHFEK